MKGALTGLLACLTLVACVEGNGRKAESVPAAAAPGPTAANQTAPIVAVAPNPRAVPATQSGANPGAQRVVTTTTTTTTTATTASPVIRGALSGKKQQIEAFYIIAADCSSLGYPTLKVAQPPQHGEISIEQGTVHAFVPKTDPRSDCNGKLVPATLLFYTSVPGFIGTDSASFDRIGVNGAYGYHSYMINVR